MSETIRSRNLKRSRDEMTREETKNNDNSSSNENNNRAINSSNNNTQSSSFNRHMRISSNGRCNGSSSVVGANSSGSVANGERAGVVAGCRLKSHSSSTKGSGIDRHSNSKGTERDRKSKTDGSKERERSKDKENKSNDENKNKNKNENKNRSGSSSRSRIRDNNDDSRSRSRSNSSNKDNHGRSRSASRTAHNSSNIKNCKDSSNLRSSRSVMRKSPDSDAATSKVKDPQGGQIPPPRRESSRGESSGRGGGGGVVTLDSIVQRNELHLAGRNLTRPVLLDCTKKTGGGADKGVIGKAAGGVKAPNNTGRGGGTVARPSVYDLGEFKRQTREEVNHLIDVVCPSKVLRMNELLARLRVHGGTNSITPQPQGQVNNNGQSGGRGVEAEGEEGRESKRRRLTGGVGDNNGILVPGNAGIDALIDVIRPHLITLQNHVKLIHTFITLITPRIQDGNNFGVQVLGMIDAEALGIDAMTSSRLESFADFYQIRADRASTSAATPRVHDSARALDVHDMNMYVTLRSIVTDIRDSYASLLTLLTNNRDKLDQPRPDNSLNMY